MPERRDAFLAGAEIALAVELAVKSTGSLDTVGTTGVCRLFPVAVNSVPSRCDLKIDVRDTTDIAETRCCRRSSPGVVRWKHAAASRSI
jgi:hypothetical protein